MAYGDDVTEGLPYSLSNPGASRTFQMTGEAYDLSINGLPFYIFSTDETPYRRQTAPYRKEQVDQTREPGEQTLTGWWVRSQSSFHAGDGINYYDPAAGETVAYRYADSKGVDVWTKGEVTLLNESTPEHETSGALQTNGKRNQSLRSIKWETNEGVLLHDEYDVDKIDKDGNVTNFVDYAAAGAYKVFDICDDGVTAYWVTLIDDAGTDKTAFYKKPLTGSSASTADVTEMFKTSSVVVNNAVIDYVKERIVACVNNAVYELTPSATSLSTAVYTHPNTNHVFTSVTASGPAIYVAGYTGIQSTILKFTLSTAGIMPTLTSAIVSAELPVGEIVHKIFYYLGYMAIGTNKGIRIAAVSDQDGSVNYGPLIVETTQPCYDFAARDTYIWAATGIDGAPGLIRIDLSNEIETLRFAWANDVYYPSGSGHETTAVAFANGTDQLVYATRGVTKGGTITNKAMTTGVATITTASAHGLVTGNTVWVQGVDTNFNSTTSAFTITSTTTNTITYTSASTATVSSTAVSAATALVNVPGNTYIESESTKLPTGYLTTGRIRYNTLENKLFKLLTLRIDNVDGGITAKSISPAGIEYNIGGFAEDDIVSELSISYPPGAQEYLSFKFTLSRSATDTTKGCILKGYQVKALPAIPRQRLIQYPLACYDNEKDKFGTIAGYEGSAYDRLVSLESVENVGDSIRIEDFRSEESYVGLIEEIQFVNRTPPDKRFSGFGGVLYVTIRSL
jgi:hypothetical protein